MRKNPTLFLRFYSPHPSLQTVVSSIMVSALDGARGVTSTPYPPLPEQSLFFYPRSRITTTIHGTDKSVLNPASIFVGPQLRRVDISLGDDHVVIRVGFKPGGLHRLLGVPMHEIIDQAQNGTDFFSGEVKQVNERLCNTAGYDEMVQIVQQFLMQKVPGLKKVLPVDHALLMLMQSGGSLTVDRVASAACLSPRQFERQCKERIGLPPKLFARVIRFSKAYRLFESSPGLTWTQIAHQCGYFDQMHFIRDCKSFGGVTPTVIAKEVRHAPTQLQFMLPL